MADRKRGHCYVMISSAQTIDCALDLAAIQECLPVNHNFPASIQSLFALKFTSHPVTHDILQPTTMLSDSHSR